VRKFRSSAASSESEGEIAGGAEVEAVGNQDRRSKALEEKRGQMRTGYEIRSGRRAVGIRHAATPREALVEYLRSIGCRNDEIVTMDASTICWRGAVFTAQPLSES
jgi:hypothetical protein